MGTAAALNYAVTVGVPLALGSLGLVAGTLGVRGVENLTSKCETGSECSMRSVAKVAAKVFAFALAAGATIALGAFGLAALAPVPGLSGFALLANTNLAQKLALALPLLFPAVRSGAEKVVSLVSTRGADKGAEAASTTVPAQAPASAPVSGSLTSATTNV